MAACREDPSPASMGLGPTPRGESLMAQGIRRPARHPKPHWRRPYRALAHRTVARPLGWRAKSSRGLFVCRQSPWYAVAYRGDTV